MPRISDSYTQNVVYIYATVDGASAGNPIGGSGFLVHVWFEISRDRCQTYAVTNRHVVLSSLTPVIRQANWTLHPDGDDVAVLPVNLRLDETPFMSVGLEQFVTPQLIRDEDIGIGDDTIMVGRFIGHDGRQRNTPSVRFGNIAMMPNEKIVATNGFEQESFLVEQRSLPGYSGSAVYIYSPYAELDMSARRGGVDMALLSQLNLFGSDAQASIDLMMKKRAPKGPYLLGIDWCHLNNLVPVLDAGHQPHSERMYVRENAGMAGVVPAWKIAEVLNTDELADRRRKIDRRIADRTVTSSNG